MNVTKFVFKSHKWLAVGTGLIAFFWFFSGIFMTIPNQVMRAFADASPQEPPKQDAVPFRDMQVSIPEAIRVVDGELGHTATVEGIELRKIEGRLYYRVATTEGVRLVNSHDGSLLTISEDVARRIVQHSGVTSETLRNATRLDRYSPSYTYGPLPAWRIESNDAKATIYYVAEYGGDLRSTQRMGRIHEYIVGLHSLEFLRGWLSRRVLRLIMWIFSIVGTGMTLFGFWILWLQYKGWLARRAA